jgi:hypothetical protein
MKFNLNIYVCILLISLFVSCSKEKADDTNNGGSNKLQAFWKGSTSPMQTSSAYAVGVLLKQNGAARAFRFYGSSIFPSDTSLSTVLKTNGSYLLTSDSLIITCNSGGAVFVYRAAATSDTSALQGKLSYGESGGLVFNNLTVNMSK